MILEQPNFLIQILKRIFQFVIDTNASTLSYYFSVSYPKFETYLKIPHLCMIFSMAASSVWQRVASSFELSSLE